MVGLGQHLFFNQALHENLLGFEALCLPLWLNYDFVIVAVQSLSRVQLCDPMDCSTDFSILILSPRLWSNSCLLSQWCHPTISSSVCPFSYCLQSFPASGSSPTNHLFTSDGQIIGASASASVLPMNIQGQFPLGWTGWISLQSKGLSKVFSNTTVQKHQFFSTRPSL